MNADEAARHIKRRPDGTLYLQPYLGTDPVTGRRIRPSHTLKARDPESAEAREEAAAWLSRYDGTVTVNQAVAMYAEHERASKAENTAATHGKYARLYVCPNIGRLPVRDVTPATLARLQSKLEKGGGAGGRALAGGTVRGAMWYLSGMFRWLAEMGYIDASPVKAVKVGSNGSARCRSFAAEEREAISSAIAAAMAQDEDVEARCTAMLAWLGLNAGLRVGEACGLRRCDFDRASGALTVCGTVVDQHGAHRQDATKTKRQRSVPLGPTACEVVAGHLAWESTVVAGLGPRSPMVTASGAWIAGSAASTRFKAMCDELGIAGAKFHMLRHTHASVLVARGVDVRTVSERLGHARPSTTMDVYAHAEAGLDRRAAEIAEAAFIAAEALGDG